MRRADSKTALGQQRAQLRRGSRHKDFVGQDTGAAEARAAELAKVRKMQAEERARETRVAIQRVQSREIEHAYGEAEQEDVRRERLAEPVSIILADLVSDSLRLARTLVGLPFRLLAALRGHRPREA